jgi:hypothetical protein
MIREQSFTPFGGVLVSSAVLWFAACQPTYRAVIASKSLPPSRDAVVTEAEMALTVGMAERIIFEIRDGDTTIKDVETGDIEVTSNTPSAMSVLLGADDKSFVFLAERPGEGRLVVRYKRRIALELPFRVSDPE